MPAVEGYGKKRKAVFAYVAALRAQLADARAGNDEACAILEALLAETGPRGARQVQGFHTRAEIERAIRAARAVAGPHKEDSNG